MNKKSGKPTPEAKALSLFLMAHKALKPIYKQQLKRINKSWDLLVDHDISKAEYLAEVDDMLASHGGYHAVIEQTVRFYIQKTGEWKLQGDDKYCQDAQAIADKILGK